MLTTAPTPSLKTETPPPLWMLFHAGNVVGPVSTNRLVRGVLHERIPGGAIVRERAWSRWRPLERIREVAELRRNQARYGRVVIPRARFGQMTASRAHREEHLHRLLRRATDPGDVMLLSLGEIMRSTGALVGAVHRYSRTERRLVTTAVSGPGTMRRLGHSLPEGDPVVALAQRGATLCCAPDTTRLARVVSDRLGAFPASAGVAMVPVVVAGRVIAVVELGRPDHAFRRADRDEAARVVRAAADRLGVVRNRLQR